MVGVKRPLLRRQVEVRLENRPRSRGHTPGATKLLSSPHPPNHTHTHTPSGPLWQMSLFKLTEVRPDSLPLLQHPEKPLSSSQRPPAPSSMLIMANFCLVSSFSRTQPPLLRPCLTLPPPCLYTPIHTEPLHAPRPPTPTPLLTPLFFHPVGFTHSLRPLVWTPALHFPLDANICIYMLRQGVWVLGQPFHTSNMKHHPWLFTSCVSEDFVVWFETELPLTSGVELHIIKDPTLTKTWFACLCLFVLSTAWTQLTLCSSLTTFKHIIGVYLSVKSKIWCSHIHTDLVLWNENEEVSVTETDAKQRRVC